MSILSRTGYAIITSSLCFITAGGLQARPQSTGTQSTTANSSADSKADTTFVTKAAQGGMAEVKMGQLAQEKGSSQAVKDFGQKMVQDHSKADDQLKEVAAKDNLAVPAELSAKDQDTYNKLSKLSGSAFDRAYAQDMIKDHEMDISEFKKEASSGKNTDVKNFASETLPTLQEHLKLAEQMNQDVTGSATSKGAGSPGAHGLP